MPHGLFFHNDTSSGCDDRAFCRYVLMNSALEVKERLCPDFSHQLVQLFAGRFLDQKISVYKVIAERLRENNADCAFSGCRHTDHHNVGFCLTHCHLRQDSAGVSRP